ncbi:MAG: hypothetical protein BZY87_03755 [SAR202 cluster bacterium Io17-Chloro-G6]|nr:MAG: hypothetical protein BZY87_03755 [SAR202 cluster bacterium Io17-Chloro-G6]
MTRQGTDCVQWPWVRPIRSYVQGCDPQQLQSEMGPGASDTANRTEAASYANQHGLVITISDGQG